MEENDFPSPRIDSSIAAMVLALGISGSKGMALSWATRIMSKRKASETVRPIVAKTAAASALVFASIRARTTSFAGMGVLLSYNVAQRYEIFKKKPEHCCSGF